MAEQASEKPAWLNVGNVLLALYTLAYAWLRYVYAGITDDAYITFVYARNLVEGTGFVFNPGERIYGTTSPVFGLFVAVGIALGLEPWTWVLGWDIVWLGLILWRLRQLMELHGGGQWFWLAGLMLLVAAADTLPVAGMETGPYLLAILSALVTLGTSDRKWVPVAWAVGAACLRPDGVVILAVALLFATGPLWWRREWRVAAIASAPVLALIPFALLTLALFGTIVPHSMQAKALNTASAPFEATMGFDLVRFLTNWFGRVQWIAVAGLALIFGFGWQRPHWPVVAFLAGYVAFFVLGGAPRFAWYMTPIVVLWYAASAMAVGLAVEWTARKLAPRPVPPAMMHALAFVVAALLFSHQARVYMAITRMASKGWGIRTDLTGYREAARYIRTQDPDPLVAAHEIGTIGWFLRGRIFDMEGLVSPEALRLRAAGQADRLLEASGAGWFIHPYPYFGEKPEGIAWLGTEPHFASVVARGYEPVAWFDCPFTPTRTVVFRKKALVETKTDG